jgi:hypothetical protein
VTTKEGYPFLRDITEMKRMDDGIATEATLACGHTVILIGDTERLTELYGRPACQCSLCLNEWVEQQKHE